jgi:PAS domain S-box-containing protein
MADTKDFKKQRDRFLAFSFASADLFIEVAENGKVAYALGAAKSLTGVDHQTLVGHNWLDVFSPADRMTLAGMYKQAREGERCGPLSVTMDEILAGGKKAIVTALQMPGKKEFHVTIGFTSLLMEQLAEAVKEHAEYKLLDKDHFIYAAQEALDLARSLGQNLEMTLVDIADTRAIKGRLGDEVWDSFTTALTEVLGSHSFDGQTAARITEGRYSIIHDRSVNPDKLCKELIKLSKTSDPDGKGFKIENKNVSADLAHMSERETMKALVYTINEFERKGTSLNIDTLNTGFKAYVSANVHKIHQFKTMVEQSSFDFEFHPIIQLRNTEVSHFEMLSRFRDGGSTQEWVLFAEDIGMAADFDIAVCDRAINYLLYKSGGHGTKFAVNISGHSIQNEQFFKTLIAKLTMNKDLANRLIFEITGSGAIVALEMVDNFIGALQKHGFKVCLDDFGAGSASLPHIQQLRVDYVKIEGQYTQKILKSDRDALLVKNICKMCEDLGIKVIAERVESEEQARTLKAMGVPLAQGYYFALPDRKPVFNPEKIAAA